MDRSTLVFRKLQDALNEYGRNYWRYENIPDWVLDARYEMLKEDQENIYFLINEIKGQQDMAGNILNNHNLLFETEDWGYAVDKAKSGDSVASVILRPRKDMRGLDDFHIFHVALDCQNRPFNKSDLNQDRPINWIDGWVINQFMNKVSRKVGWNMLVIEK